MKQLFESLQIKDTRIKNRIAVPPMVMYHWSDNSGIVSAKHVAHYEAIAKGGAAIIIQEGTCVNPLGRLADSQLGIWSDEHITGLRQITEVVHQYHIPIFVQIHHAGVVGIDEDNVCPSNYECVFRDQPKKGRELTKDELKNLQQDFINAGVRAYKAGYDGVEIHACHSYLISQFLNSRINHREDEYGIKKELFAAEIIKGIRSQTPSDFIIGIRLGGFEPTLADGIDYAKKFDALGVDFLDISYGFAQESEPFVPSDYPFKDIIYAAAQIKKEVSIPVFTVNGINNPALAEDILAKTGIDMVDVGRGTLVNYNFANDAKEGKDVGTCFDCKVCMWRIDPDKCPGKIKFEKSK
jgi:2,4-dienoyl-CoA reductase-like NADH-dependent reductase (Old Yellow Enzyme family)